MCLLLGLLCSFVIVHSFITFSIFKMFSQGNYMLLYQLEEVKINEDKLLFDGFILTLKNNQKEYNFLQDKILKQHHTCQSSQICVTLPHYNNLTSNRIPTDYRSSHFKQQVKQTNDFNYGNKLMVIFQINEMEIQILVLFISMFDRIFFPLFIQRPL